MRTFNLTAPTSCSRQTEVGVLTDGAKSSVVSMHGFLADGSVQQSRRGA